MIKINIEDNSRNTHKRYKKTFILFSSAILFLTTVSVVVWNKIFLNGFKLLCNMLFNASEKYQLYEYDKFEVTESSRDFIFTLVLILLVLTAVILFALYNKNIFVITGITLLFTGVQIYFGVFPHALLNIFIYTLFAAAFIYCSPNLISLRSCAMAIIVLAAVSAIIFIVWTGKNPVLYSISENIRDQFDEKIELPVYTTSQKNSTSHQNQNWFDFLRRNPADNQKNTGDKNAQDYGIDYDYNFSASQAGTTTPKTYLLIWLFMFIWGGAFATCIIFRLLMQSKRRKLFNSPDCSVAIDAMFKYLMDWLRTYKLIPKNDVYSIYITQIENFSPKEYSDKYLNAVDIWQKAVYSEHSMTEEHREFIRLFMDETKKTVNKNVGIVTKIRLCLGYFGGAE